MHLIGFFNFNTLDKHFKYSYSNEKLGNVLYLVACKENTRFCFLQVKVLALESWEYFPWKRR